MTEPTTTPLEALRQKAAEIAPTSVNDARHRTFTQTLLHDAAHEFFAAASDKLSSVIPDSIKNALGLDNTDAKKLGELITSQSDANGRIDNPDTLALQKEYGRYNETIRKMDPTEFLITLASHDKKFGDEFKTDVKARLDEIHKLQEPDLNPLRAESDGLRATSRLERLRPGSYGRMDNDALLSLSQTDRTEMQAEFNKEFEAQRQKYPDWAIQNAIEDIHNSNDPKVKDLKGQEFHTAVWHKLYDNAQHVVEGLGLNLNDPLQKNALALVAGVSPDEIVNDPAHMFANSEVARKFRDKFYDEIVAAGGGDPKNLTQAPAVLAAIQGVWDAPNGSNHDAGKLTKEQFHEAVQAEMYLQSTGIDMNKDGQSAAVAHILASAHTPEERAQIAQLGIPLDAEQLKNAPLAIQKKAVDLALNDPDFNKDLSAAIHAGANPQEAIQKLLTSSVAVFTSPLGENQGSNPLSAADFRTQLHDEFARELSGQPKQPNYYPPVVDGHLVLVSAGGQPAPGATEPSVPGPAAQAPITDAATIKIAEIYLAEDGKYSRNLLYMQDPKNGIDGVVGPRVQADLQDFAKDWNADPKHKDMLVNTTGVLDETMMKALEQHHKDLGGRDINQVAQDILSGKIKPVAPAAAPSQPQPPVTTPQPQIATDGALLQAKQELAEVINRDLAAVNADKPIKDATMNGDVIDADKVMAFVMKDGPLSAGNNKDVLKHAIVNRLALQHDQEALNNIKSHSDHVYTADEIRQITANLKKYRADESAPSKDLAELAREAHLIPPQATPGMSGSTGQQKTS